MFTKSQQDLLKSVGRTPRHPNFGKANPELDEVILKLQRDNAKAFLTDSDRYKRVFMNEPKNANIVCKGFVFPLEQS